MLKGLRAETLEAQKKTKDLLDKASEKLVTARKANREIGQATKFLEQGKKAYEFVAKAKSVHNFDLARLILEQAKEIPKR